MDTEPSALAAGPYRTPAQLSARASIYRWQHPRVDLLGLATGALAEQLFCDAGLDRPPVHARWPLAGAREALQEAGFTEVREQVFDYVLDIPTAQPVLDYLNSCRGSFPWLTDRAWQDVRSNVTAAVDSLVQHHGSVRTTGRVGLLTAAR